MLRRKLRSLLCSRSGSTAAIVAIVLPLFLIAAAATFDMGAAYILRGQLQITADSAALAGASALPDENQARTRALDAAEANMGAEWNGEVLVEDDVVTGNWNTSTRTFTAGGAPLNAVRVVTRRTRASDNPLTSTLAGIFGIAAFDVQTSAVATNGGGVDDCLRNGFLADGRFEVGSNVAIRGDTCVHGQAGMKFGSDVQMLPPVDITHGVGSSLEGISNSGNVINDPEQEDKVIIADGQINSILSAIRNNAADAPHPSWSWTVDSQPSQDFSSCNPAKWVLYIRKKVDLSSCSGEMRDFAVFGEEIKLPSGSSGNPFRIKNMYFASNTWIETGSNIDVGSSNFCDTGEDAVFFIARNYIKFGSDIRMWGVQALSGASGPTSIGIEMGDDYETTAVAAWSDGYLKLGSTPNVDGGSDHEACDRDDHLLTNQSTLSLRLVA